MPIKGMTHTQSRPGILGKLRKGGEGPMQKSKAPNKPDYKTYGPDLDYFRFDSKDDALMRAFTAVYGPQPKSLRVMLPFATTDENFLAYREEWSASTLKHRCDGEWCYAYDRNGVMVPTDTPCPYYGLSDENRRCKPSGRLYLFLPELIAEAGRYGLVILETHAKNDIPHIWQVLSDCEERAFAHDLRGIEFVLYRQTEEVSTPNGNGTRARRLKSLVRIEATSQWAARQLEDARRAALALPAPVDDVITIDYETGEVVDDDLFAETTT